jgi:catechol 2,3-dioxygenase-like lactoylglutathione lyase family enzyme
MGELARVRYLVDDVRASVDFYTTHLGFSVDLDAAPAFAAAPEPGGWNRIQLVVEDISADVARLRAAGVSFRNEIISDPGGQQVLLQDPSGNLVELIQPAPR